MTGYKIQPKNRFGLAPDDFLNVYVIEKAPNYLPLVKKMPFFWL